MVWNRSTKLNLGVFQQAEFQCSPTTSKIASRKNWTFRVYTVFELRASRIPEHLKRHNEVFIHSSHSYPQPKHFRRR